MPFKWQEELKVEDDENDQLFVTLYCLKMTSIPTAMKSKPEKT